MMMNMEWYRIFLYAARLGNLTRAAEELHITQPSVSYALKQLEAGLGVKLFNRISKGIKLTSEGIALLEYVEQSFSLLHAGESKVHSLKNLAAGELRIGASGPIIKHLLLSPLDQFHTDNPGVRIRLSQGKTAEIRKQLKEGQIDLGFVHLPLFDHDLHVEHLITIQDCFVVGPAYRGMANHPISSAELAQIPLLLLSQGSSTRQFVEQWLSSQGLSVEVDIELSSLDMLIELAQRGYGAAFVTSSFVKSELMAEKLFQLQPIEAIPTRSIGAATRRDISLSIAAQYFMDLVRRKMLSGVL
ncbi:LysR family transcriptional regulator [Paenibacillus eucommiae]|uniref:DNA-binding transcriptional LysR family regulator n=1 Tax=Paenibacillus eucommiae TaxID=1355755 RepID=A0ABS4ITN2_9BACL|nr:LysR family transcriptional regulator [Paenibacillus eucommiae]MBP1989939.1 DNA-binding transcriptional LysR family regulator [Paenibacillus eucommiae]